MLSCYCDEDYDWFYTVDEKEGLAAAECKCYGCCGKVLVGDEIRAMSSHVLDENGDDGEEKDLGVLCETCAGLYDSLTEAGYCITADWGFITTSMEYYRDMLPPSHIMKRREKSE